MYPSNVCSAADVSCNNALSVLRTADWNFACIMHVSLWHSIVSLTDGFLTPCTCKVFTWSHSIILTFHSGMSFLTVNWSFVPGGHTCCMNKCTAIMRFHMHLVKTKTSNATCAILSPHQGTDHHQLEIITTYSSSKHDPAFMLSLLMHFNLICLMALCLMFFFCNFLTVLWRLVQNYKTQLTSIR